MKIKRQVRQKNLGTRKTATYEFSLYENKPRAVLKDCKIHDRGKGKTNRYLFFYDTLKIRHEQMDIPVHS